MRAKPEVELYPQQVFVLVGRVGEVAVYEHVAETPEDIFALGKCQVGRIAVFPEILEIRKLGVVVSERGPPLARELIFEGRIEAPCVHLPVMRVFLREQGFGLPRQPFVEAFFEWLPLERYIHAFEPCAASGFPKNIL